MTGALVLALLAFPAAAQEPALEAQASAAAAAPGEGAPEISTESLIKVKVHGEARVWTPVSLRKGGNAGTLRTRFTRRIVRKGKKTRGESSRARAVARVHPAKDDKLLVVSVFPDALRPFRKHLEVRYLVIEGYLEKARVAVVTAERGGAKDDDSILLRRRGVPYLEEFPGGGDIRLAAISLSPGAGTVNAARLSNLAFADKELRLTSFSYKTVGLGGKQQRTKPRAPAMASANTQGTTAGKETAPAKQFPSEAEARYKGPFGCELQLPTGYEAVNTSPMRQGGEAVSFQPKGSAEGAVRLEALPIDNPAIGGRADLPVYKAQISEQLKAAQSQFTATDFSMPLPGFEIKVSMPRPQVIVAMQGKKTMFVFSAASDGPVLRGLLSSLKEAP